MWLFYPFILIITCCIIYEITIGIPKKLEKIDKDVEMLKLHLKEVNIKLDRISKKLDQREQLQIRG